jgi:galactokinase
MQELRTAFASLYDRPATALVRAPGRVNLIGEHTDYSDLPVLPIAMDRATWLAAAPRDDGVLRARSTRFEGEAILQPDGAGGSAAWHRYLAGALAQLPDLAGGRGADLLVGGDLPTTGGLSSSSSFTVGLLASLNQIWELGLELDRLVELAIVAERHVGVESGGMDQTVIAHASAGTALRIDFAPPRVRRVPLPPELRVVVAYSGQEAPKGGSARDAYNERVIGCRLAAALLGHRLDREARVLGQVARDADAKMLTDLPERATPARVARELGVDPRPLVQFTAGAFDPEQPVPVRTFARHVLSEAERVDRAEAALAADDLEGFGGLLDASHHSLASDYRCSTEGLDRLCQAMRDAGALGARLTGAGFGGYALAAARPDRIDAVIDAAKACVRGPVFETFAADGLTVSSGCMESKP